MSSFPTAAKRRQFERHKCNQNDEDEEADDEEETRAQIRTLTNHHLASCAVGKLASNSLVTSKIGLFERLSYGAAAGAADTCAGSASRGQQDRFSRQIQVDEGDEIVHEMVDEQVLFGEEDDDLDEEDYLVLDTIVEEDEESAVLDVDETKTPTTTPKTTKTQTRNEMGCETNLLSSASKLHRKQQATSQRIAAITDCGKCDENADEHSHQKLDCDKLATLTTQNSANINNNVPSSATSVVEPAERAQSDFAANSAGPIELDMIAAASLERDKNNGRRQARVAQSTNDEIGSEQQPPAAMETSTSTSSSSSSSSSPSPSSIATATTAMADATAEEKEEENNKSCSEVRKLATKRQQVGVVSADVSQECHEVDVEKESISIQLTSSTSDNMTTSNIIGPATNFNDNLDSLSQTANSLSFTPAQSIITTTTTTTTTANKKEEPKSNQMTNRQQISANTNKMQYQTLLPSTNRLISEHQARQQQALFRALNERQKILDELGPDERLEQADLMSSSCVSLNLHGNGANSKRQWRKTLARRNASDSLTLRSRSNSASAYQQKDATNQRQRRRRDASKSGGVPLSSVDLSSMTDQQVDEILGHIAPASSSSSLVSSNASLLDDSSSGSDDSSAGDSSSSSYSTDELDGQDALAADGQTQHKSLMLRRLVRRRLATDSEQRAANSHHFTNGNHGLAAGADSAAHHHQQQQGLAPSVIGVHEDDSMSVNSARRSLRSSARKCREAFKKRGRNGLSDDDEDGNGDHEHDRRNQGDLFVSVASASSRGGDQQTGGLGHGSGQCSLSPLANQSQTIAGGNSSANIGANNGGSSNLLLASVMRNQQLLTNGVGGDQQHDHSLSSSSIALSASQSPTTSDEPVSMSASQQQAHHRPQACGQSVEAILSRMLGALDEVGAHEEQEQLNDLLERGFLHLEQLLNCSLTPQNSTLPRSQYQKLQQQQHQHHTNVSLNSHASLISSGVIQPQQSQKDSDYGSDTQSNGDCFSSSTSHPGQEQTVGGVVVASSNGGGKQQQQQQQQQQTTAGVCSPVSPRLSENAGPDRQQSVGPVASSSLSPLAIELSFRLAESLRRLAQQQARRQQQQMQPEAAMTTTSGAPIAASQCESSEPVVNRQTAMDVGDEQPPKARMKSVVMINSNSSSRPISVADDGRNMTPVEDSTRHTGGESVSTTVSPIGELATTVNASNSRPESQQSARQQFKTRVNLNGAKCSAENSTTAPNDTQVVKVISVIPVTSGGGGQFERVSRRSSFKNSSLRRRPSFSGSIVSVHREPGAPRPGSPVPRSVLEMVAQAAAANNSTNTTNTTTLPNCKQASKSNGVKMSASAKNQQQEAIEQEPHNNNNNNNKQQHQLQRALILAQKYNYSPAKLATSKLSSKLNLKELIATDNNYEQQQQNAHGERSSSGMPNGGNPNSNCQQSMAKTLLANGNIKSNINDHDGQFVLGNSAATNYNVNGQVQLDISYFARTGSLTVHLLQCSQLAPVNKRRATSNPYVKLYLLPDRTKSGKRKSSVKRRQLNPKFNERFTFGPLQLHEFDSRTLWLSVWHKDRGLSRNEFLGELYLPMSRVRQQLLTSDLCQSISSRWYKLTSPLEYAAETLRQNEQIAAPIRHADGTLLTTKKIPLSNGLHTTLNRQPVATSGEQAATELSTSNETDTVKKLSEFEKKAARLTQHHHLFATDSIPKQQTNNNEITSKHVSRDFSRLEQNKSSISEPIQRNTRHQQSAASSAGLNLNLDGPGQAPLKTLQVTLGPLQQQQSTSGCSISGKLFVALKFVPESGEALAKRSSAQVWGSLHVLIKEARDIGGFKSMTGRGDCAPSDQLPSPFCKCLLLDSNGQKMIKQKTNQLRRTNSPRWDQELVFPRLKVANLQAQAIEVQLFNRDSILVSSSEHLGSIRLCKRLKETETATGPLSGDKLEQDSINGRSNSMLAANNLSSVSSSGSIKSSTSSSSTTTTANTADDDLCSEREARLWSQMLTRPNIWVYGELPLRQLRPLVPFATPTTISLGNK